MFAPFIDCPLPSCVVCVVLDRPAALTWFRDQPRRVLVQVCDVREARAAADEGADGLIVKGCEAAGRAAEESTPVLLQRVLSAVDLPVWAQGGIGPRGAAAVLAAGARGWVLDTQLACVREAGLERALVTRLAALDGSEPRRVLGHNVYIRRNAPQPEENTSSEQLFARLGTDLERCWLPIGSDAGFASWLGERHGSTAALVRAYERAADGYRTVARRVDPFGPGARLSRELGVQHPIVQGPMTRVSDHAEFAAAVADAGGLPFIAANGGDKPSGCLELEGLVYSPGGDVLPKCEPFHPTTNNPYAVRCIDAWPWYRTEFPGDEYCILPPPPEKGIQVGVHPQGKQWFAQVSTGDMSGYANVHPTFLMEPGGEGEGNYHTSATNSQAQNYYRHYPRMRSGSHHMIISTSAGSGQDEVWGSASADGLLGGMNLPGAQRPDENGPPTLGKPTEDAGLYSVLPANPSVAFNMHHFNVTQMPILKETWLNLWWEKDATVPAYGLIGLDFGQVGALEVPAGAAHDLHYSWPITEPVRLVSLFGHRHAWTTSFTSWIEAPNKEPEILYQSFSWRDEPTYRYDSITQNPPPAPQARTDGGASGLRMLNPGDELHFNCHIEFTEERAASENAPPPSEIGTLRFANETLSAEMCIMFGFTAAVRLPAPTASTAPLPSFATMD